MSEWNTTETTSTSTPTPIRRCTLRFIPTISVNIIFCFEQKCTLPFKLKQQTNERTQTDKHEQNQTERQADKQTNILTDTTSQLTMYIVFTKFSHSLRRVLLWLPWHGTYPRIQPTKLTQKIFVLFFVQSNFY